MGWRSEPGQAGVDSAAESAKEFAADTETTRPWRSGWLWLCVALTGLKLWLVAAQTVYAIAPLPGDDELFLSQAETILKGEWLGPLTDLRSPAEPSGSSA